MGTYKSESSINKALAELQIASAMVQDVEDDKRTAYEGLLRKALQSENEAIAIYNELAEKSEALGSKTLVKAFNELKKDETEHIGNLNFLLRTLCPETTEVEKDGEAEEAKLQSTKPIE